MIFIVLSRVLQKDPPVWPFRQKGKKEKQFFQRYVRCMVQKEDTKTKYRCISIAWAFLGLLGYGYHKGEEPFLPWLEPSRVAAAAMLLS